MELTWIGHSCFRLRGREASIITDPCARGSGYSLNKATAEVVTISNTHPNHDARDEVAGNPTVLDGPGEYEVKGILISGVRTPLSKKNVEATRNTAYIMTIDDITVCHLGDISALLVADQIEQMKDVDVLLVPVGGHCTIGAQEAVEVIAQVEPKLVIPMHYQTEQSKVELEPVDQFLREMGMSQAQPQARLNVTHSSLPAEPTVALLSYRK